MTLRSTRHLLTALTALSLFAAQGCSTDTPASPGEPDASPQATAPRATADEKYVVAAGTTLRVAAAEGLLANDELGDPKATLVSFGGEALGGAVGDHAAGTSAPAEHGSVTVNADGSFVFTPASGFTGPFAFSYRLQNSAGTSDAAVRILVRAGPVAGDDSYVTAPGTTVSRTAADADNLLGNDSGDPAPRVLSFGDGTLGGEVTSNAAGASATVPEGTLTVGADGSFSFAPAADFKGTFSFRYRIGNDGGTADAAVAIEVREAAAITSPNAATFRVGTAGSFAITASGAPVPELRLEGTLPAGLAFSTGAAGTASISGTPQAGTAGTHPVKLVASNGVSADAEQALTLTVQQSPSITGTPDVAHVGQAYSFTFGLQGFPAPVLTLASGTLPPGLSLTGATLAGTPTVAGHYGGLRLTASNGVGEDAALEVALDVVEAPRFTSAAQASFSLGEAGSFTVTTTGHPKAAVQAGSLPAGLTFADKGDGTATLSGTPTAAGAATVQLTASNGQQPDATQSLQVLVTQPAGISALPPAGRVGEPYLHPFAVSGFPLPTVALISGTLPPGITLTGETLSGTPTGSGSFGPITVGASNGIQTPATLTFTLEINEAPAITSADLVTFRVGQQKAFTVVASGYPLPVLTVGGAGLPLGLTLVDQGDGTALLSGTPADGTAGTHTVSVTASNGIPLSALQSLRIVVEQEPTIAGLPMPGRVGVAYEFRPTLGGYPAPTLSLASGTLPAGLAVTADAIRGTPTEAGHFGIIVLNASNGVGTPATLPLALEIAAPPEFTSAASAGFVVGAQATFTVSTRGHPAPAITVVGTLPAGLTLVDRGDGTALLSGTPGAGVAGQHTVTLKAANGVSPDATQSLAVTVNMAPTIAGPPSVAKVGQAFSHAFTLGGFPVPTLSVTAGSLPPGLALSAGGISGVPTASGRFPGITVSAGNGVGTDATLTFAMDVQAPPAFASGPTVGFVVGVAGTFTISASGYPVPAVSALGTLPAGLTLVDRGDGTAVLSGTPLASAVGQHTVPLKATNGVSPDATQSLVVTVGMAPTIAGVPPVAKVGQAYSHAFTLGGFPAPTLSVTAGSLPPGLALSMGAISGVPTAAGRFPGITVSAGNGIGADATLTFAMEVQAPPAFTSGPAAGFVVDVAGTFTVSASGYPAPAISALGTLPAGLSLVDRGDGTAVLSGTPLASAVGQHTVSLEASNAVSPDATQSLSISITQAPSISGTPPSGQVGKAYSFSFTVGGHPAPSLAVVGGTLPPGLRLTGNTLAGTPTSAGRFAAITVRAGNGVGSVATTTFDLDIVSPPSFHNANTASFVVGTEGTFSLAATGHPAPAFTVVGSLPAGLSLTDRNDGSAVISGTPAPAAAGQHTATIRASNGVAPDATLSLALTIGMAPAIAGLPPTARVGQAYSHAFTVTGYPAATVSLAAGTLPPGLTLSGSSISGTPTASGHYAGITVSASNGVGSAASLTFALDVQAPPAFTSAASATMLAGTAASFTVSASGHPAPVITAVSSLPAGLTVTDQGNGTALLAGTPNAGAVGAHAITFKATNGVGADATQSFALTIAAAPTIAGTPPAGWLDQPYSYTFQVGGHPAPTLRVSSGTLPPGLSLSGAALSGTPTYAGRYQGITVTASNGMGTDASITFDLVIQGAPRFVSGASVIFTAGRFNSFFLEATGYPAPSITPIGSLPAGLVLTDNRDGTALLSGTPAASTAGEHLLSFVASNGNAPDAMADIRLIVGLPPSITGTPPDALVGDPYNFTFTVDGYPTPTVRLLSGRIPRGLTLTGATLSGVPIYDYYLSNTFTVIAENGVTPSAQLAVTIKIVEQPPMPQADTFAFTGNIPIFVPAPGVLANDDNNTGTILSASATASMPYSPTLRDVATAQGGRVSLWTDGTFSYYPPAGLRQNDEFYYSVRNSHSEVVTKVTLAVSGLVWFVDNRDATTGNGTYERSFATLAEAEYRSAPGDAIFVSSSSTPHATGIRLKERQVLFGGGWEDAAALGIQLAPHSPSLAIYGDPPTLGGTVVLANDVTVAKVSVTPAAKARGVTDENVALTGVKVAINTVTTSGAEAVALGATRGAFTFGRIVTSGGPSGIVLNGTRGSFAVTGVMVNGYLRGGSIVDTLGPAIKLTNTENATFEHLYIARAKDDGIQATTVANLALRDVDVESCGDADGESGLELDRVTGLTEVTKCRFSTSYTNQITINNDAGSHEVVVSQSTFTDPAAPVYRRGIFASARGSANQRVTVASSQFTGHRRTHFDSVATAQAVQTIRLTDNTLKSATVQRTERGISIVGDDSFEGLVDYAVERTTIVDAGLVAIEVIDDTSRTGAFTGRLVGNQIGTPGVTTSGSYDWACMNIRTDGNGSHQVSVLQNKIYGCKTVGIYSAAQGGTGTLNATVESNLITDLPTAVYSGYYSSAGSGSASEVNLMMLRLANNTFTVPAGKDGFLLRQRVISTFKLSGYTGAPGDVTAVANHVKSMNTVSSGQAQTDYPTGGGFVGF